MFKKPTPKSHLEIEIDSLIVELDEHEATSDKYGTVVERLSKLHKIRQEEKPDRLNPNTILTTVANFLGIVLIIKHEQFNFITSKAMSFVSKPK